MAGDPIKVYDARWEVSEFDDAAIRRLFEATMLYGRELGADTLTLARDARLGAARVLEIAIETAMDHGMRVHLCPHPISTPQSYYLTACVTRKHPATMGLTITASHNPANYIGVKFVVPQMQAIGLDCGPQGGLTRVRHLYHRATASRVPGGVLEIVEGRAYMAFSMRQAGVRPGDLRGLRVVLDGFHGSAGSEVYTTLRRCGVEVIGRRLIPNGHFPTGSPNPTSRNKMDEAVACAAEHDCHAVIGLDGDGDRIVFGDRRGILSAGFVAVPLLSRLTEAHADRQPPRVLYDPKVNPRALAEWASQRVQPMLFRNGHSQIKDYMRQINALAAAEESGHYYHRMAMNELTFYCENSLLTVLLFLSAIKADGRLLDELWRMQNEIAVTGEFNYQFSDDSTRDQALVAMTRHFVQAGAVSQTTAKDGMDLQGTLLTHGIDCQANSFALQPGWYSGYLRIATNEKGVVRSYFSASDSATCQRIEQEARTILETQFAGRVID